MPSAAQEFYGNSQRDAFSREDILAGKVIRLSPALVTIIDGRVGNTSPAQLQREVTDQVARLLDHHVRSFHLDLNFGDYTALGPSGPEPNDTVFTPDFVADLNQFIRTMDGYLTLHLVSNFPERHLELFENVSELGAVCFQLDVIVDGTELATLMQRILDRGATVSPVIETVGSDRLTPPPPPDVLALVGAVLPQVDMLTFQAAGTASRSNQPGGGFHADALALYLDNLKRAYFGTLQFQGGITVETAAQAVDLGADFLVCGTQLFHHPDGFSPTEVVDLILEEAARVLGDRAPNVDYQMDE